MVGIALITGVNMILASAEDSLPAPGRGHDQGRPVHLRRRRPGRGRRRSTRRCCDKAEGAAGRARRLGRVLGRPARSTARRACVVATDDLPAMADHDRLRAGGRHPGHARAGPDRGRRGRAREQGLSGRLHGAGGSSPAASRARYTVVGIYAENESARRLHAAGVGDPGPRASRSRPWLPPARRRRLGRPRAPQIDALLADSPEVSATDRGEFVDAAGGQLRHGASDGADPAGAGHPDRGARHRQHAGAVGAGTHPGAGAAAGGRAQPRPDDAHGHRRGGGDLGLRGAARRRGRHRARRRGGPGPEGRGHHRAGAALDRDGYLPAAGALVGVVAAVLPAIRAARINVLGAIAYE